MFTQNGSVFKNFVTLQDRGTNPLFSGSLVYAFVSEESYVLGIKNGMQDIVLPPMPDFVGSNVGSVWDNMIAYNSFAGIQNPKITLQGTWVTDVGSYGQSGEPILTPYKLTIMAASGRTFYLNDERIIKNMIIESGSQLYSEYGIPIKLGAPSIRSAAGEGMNQVRWSVPVTEDKV